VFGSPEFGFSRIAEDLCYRASFAGLDAVVEIFKDPIQPLPEGAAHTALARSHEADQENAMAG
jgi:hypothetical protein